MADDLFDIGEGDGSASPDALQRMRQCIAELIDTENEIEELEARVVALKEGRQEIRNRRLPNIMDEVQTSRLEHLGWEIKVSDYCSGKLPSLENAPKERKAAFAELKRAKAEGLIKTDVSISFPKSQHKEAQAFIKALKAMKLGFPVNVTTGVHAGTLQAFGRKCLEDGVNIDFGVLGLNTGRLAKIKKLDDSKKGSKKKSTGETETEQRG